MKREESGLPGAAGVKARRQFGRQRECPGASEAYQGEGATSWRRSERDDGVIAGGGVRYRVRLPAFDLVLTTTGAVRAAVSFFRSFMISHCWGNDARFWTA